MLGISKAYCDVIFLVVFKVSVLFLCVGFDVFFPVLLMAPEDEDVSSCAVGTPNMEVHFCVPYHLRALCRRIYFGFFPHRANNIWSTSTCFLRAFSYT